MSMEPLVSIDGGGGQLVKLYAHPTHPELILMARDRDSDTAVVVLTRAGADQLYAALAGWLQEGL